MTHGIAATDIEQTRRQTNPAHIRKNFFCPLDAHPPVLRVTALRTHVECHSRKIGLEFSGFVNDALDLGGMRTEFARQWPIAPYVGSVNRSEERRVGKEW